MSINDAFGLLLKHHRRQVLIGRPGVAGVSTYVTPSNYFRSAEGPGEVSVEGREFVIDANDLAAISHTLRRGDVIADSELGECVVTEIREMFGFGGGIIGYRVRCG